MCGSSAAAETAIGPIPMVTDEEAVRSSSPECAPSTIARPRPAAEAVGEEPSMEAWERPTVTPDVRTRFSLILKELQPRGDFGACARFPFVEPLLRVQGMDEPLAFPLPRAHADKLREIGEQTSRGHFISSQKLQFGASERWDPALTLQQRDAAEALGVPAARARLRGLLLCSSSSATEHAKHLLSDCFGCFEVVLPSIRTGGELAVRYDDTQKRLDPDGSPALDLRWAAYYHVCEREVLPLQSGYRLVLVYDLHAGLPLPSPPSQKIARTRLGRLAHTWTMQGSHAPKKLVHFVKAEASSWDELKKKEVTLAAALEEATDGGGPAFDLVILQAKRTLCGHGEEKCDFAWKEGPRKLPSPLNKYVLIEKVVKPLRSEFVQGDNYWAKQKADYEEEDSGSEDEEDYSSDHTYGSGYPRGYVHSSDTLRTRHFSRTAIVLWPCRRRVCTMSPGLAIRMLQEALDAADAGNPFETMELLGHASISELMHDVADSNNCAGPELLAQAVRHNVAVEDCAHVVSRLFLRDESEAPAASLLLLKAVRHHGCSAMSGAIRSLFERCTSLGRKEVSHTAAWKLLRCLSEGAPPADGSSNELRAVGVHQICIEIAPTLVKRLAVSEALLGKDRLQTRAATATIVAAVNTLHLLGCTADLVEATRLIAAGGLQLNTAYSANPTQRSAVPRFDSLCVVLPAMGVLRKELPALELPLLADSVSTAVVKADWRSLDTTKILRQLVDAGLTERCVPSVQNDVHPITFLRSVDALLNDPQHVQEVSTCASIGEALLHLASSALQISHTKPDKQETIVQLFLASDKFDAGAAASGRSGYFRTRMAAAIKSAAGQWKPDEVVALAVIRLEEKLGESAKHHSGFRTLLDMAEACARSVKSPSVVKDWALSVVHLSCKCCECSRVETFLRNPLESSKEFTGERFTYCGHSTMVAQAAEKRHPGLFKTRMLSNKGAMKYGRFQVQKVQNGQAAEHAIRKCLFEGASAALASRIFEGVLAMRNRLDQVLSSRQPPVNVQKYWRILRAKHEGTIGEALCAAAEDERQARAQLPTPKEAARLAVGNIVTASPSGEDSSTDSAIAFFSGEGEHLTKWVAAHFDKSRHESIMQAIEDNELDDVKVLASLSSAELCELLLGEEEAQRMAAHPELCLAMRELELALRRLRGAADDGDCKPRTAICGLNGEAPMRTWTLSLDNHPGANARTFTMVVAGDSGTGKSTLLNALLGYELLPTSCCRACTAAVIDLSWGEWGANVHFIPEEEWRATCVAACDAQARAGAGRTPPTDDPGHVAFEQVRAVYGAGGPPLEDPEALVSHATVAACLGRVKQLNIPRGGGQGEALANLVKPYVDSPDDADGGSLWPLVRQVELSGPFGVLLGGVRLRDVPGLHDDNAARNAVLRSILAEADALLIVSAITRAVNDKGAKDLMPKALRERLLREGCLGSLAFVASKSDNLSPSEVQQNLNLPPGTPLLACAAARNAFTCASVANDFYKDMPVHLLPANRLGSSPSSSDSSGGCGHSSLWTCGFEFPVFTVSARDALKLEGVVTGDAPPTFATLEATQIPALRAYIGLAATHHHALASQGMQAQVRTGEMLVEALEARKEAENADPDTTKENPARNVERSAGARTSSVAIHHGKSSLNRPPSTQVKRNLPLVSGLTMPAGQAHASSFSAASALNEEASSSFGSVHKKARKSVPSTMPNAFVIDLCDSD